MPGYAAAGKPRFIKRVHVVPDMLGIFRHTPICAAKTLITGKIAAIRFHRVGGQALLNPAKIKKLLDVAYKRAHRWHRANDTILAKMFERKV